MKVINILLTFIISINCFGQSGRKFSVDLSLQANATMNDKAFQYQRRNLGVGAGLQTNLNTKSIFKPTLEINVDYFGLLVMPVYVLPVPGVQNIELKPAVMSTYIGLFVLPLKWLFVATTFGPSFYNNKAHFGIRPSMGFYPTKSKRCAVKLSFTNIFQHYNKNNKSLGYVSFAVAYRLY